MLNLRKLVVQLKPAKLFINTINKKWFTNIPNDFDPESGLPFHLKSAPKQEKPVTRGRAKQVFGVSSI